MSFILLKTLDRQYTFKKKNQAHKSDIVELGTLGLILFGLGSRVNPSRLNVWPFLYYPVICFKIF